MINQHKIIRDSKIQSIDGLKLSEYPTNFMSLKNKENKAGKTTYQWKKVGNKI